MDLTGKTVVVTGTFANRSRAQVEEGLVALGARVTGSVSKKTDYLFAGVDADSKIEKAQKLGLTVLGEAELEGLLAAVAAAPRPSAPVEATKKGAKTRAAAPSDTKTVPGMAGKSVVVTGKFVKLSRTEIEAIFVASGCTVSGSVSKKTDLLIVGKDAGSKLGAANALGIRILDESAFMILLGEKLEQIVFDGPLGDWLSRFKKVAAELMTHPGVRVLNLSVNAPASDSEIAAVEEGLGVALAPAIVNLYRQANGLSLRWISKKHIEFKKRSSEYQYIDERDLRYDPATKERPSNSGAETGCICLLPLGKVFLKSRQSWKGMFVHDHQRGGRTSFRGVEYDEYEFSEDTRVFDYYNFFHMAALQLSVSPSYPPVVIGDDHGAEFRELPLDPSRPSSGTWPSIDFEKYMELALANYFSRTDRYSRERLTLRAVIEAEMRNF